MIWTRHLSYSLHSFEQQGRYAHCCWYNICDKGHCTVIHVWDFYPESWRLGGVEFPVRGFSMIWSTMPKTHSKITKKNFSALTVEVVIRQYLRFHPNKERANLLAIESVDTNFKILCSGINRDLECSAT
jgi:hypothetical protein